MAKKVKFKYEPENSTRTLGAKYTKGAIYEFEQKVAEHLVSRGLGAILGSKTETTSKSNDDVEKRNG